MLTVFEIYESIQGESTHVGRPCVFVRLAACDLRCVWCDTPYAFTGGRKMTEDEVVDAVATHGARVVEITGGEPLLQADVIPLMARLIDQFVSLERRSDNKIDAAGGAPEDVANAVSGACVLSCTAPESAVSVTSYTRSYTSTLAR